MNKINIKVCANLEHHEFEYGKPYYEGRYGYFPATRVTCKNCDFIGIAAIEQSIDEMYEAAGGRKMIYPKAEGGND